MADKLTVRVVTTVVQYFTFENADMEYEQDMVDDAKEDAELNLERREFTVEQSDARVKWEHD